MGRIFHPIKTTSRFIDKEFVSERESRICCYRHPFEAWADQRDPFVEIRTHGNDDDNWKWIGRKRKKWEIKIVGFYDVLLLEMELEKTGKLLF